MSGVQNFVNYNINTATNSNSRTASPTRRNSRTTTTTTSTTVNNDGVPQSSSSFSTNVNDMLNFIGEQIPPVIQQTFTNNRFTFNNVFNCPTADTTTTTTATNSAASNEDNISDDVVNEQPPQQAQQQNTASQNTEEPPSATSTRNVKRRASVSELTSEEDIDNLTIRQMKEILTSNFVDYKGVCERNELIERVKTLFKSHIQNKRLTDELNQQGVNNNSKEEASGHKLTEDDLCKICMDAIVDCVLLDCGHMISCTKCGKRLAECPMCRKNIIKVVRVFKS